MSSSPTAPPTATAALLFVAMMSLVGCRPATGADTASKIWFQPLEQQRPTAEPLAMATPPADADEFDRFDPVFRGVEARPVELFERSNIGRWADKIEDIYLRSGRYLELAGLYQQVVDEMGVGSRAAPRLAWVYVRLGQRHLAGPLLDKLLAEQPDNASVHFVNGAYWFNDARNSRQAAARAIRSWETTLSLNPNFSGFGPFESRSLQQQIDRLRSRLNTPIDEILPADE
jgi:tetratricopeptide (TPR) repeat protein